MNERPSLPAASDLPTTTIEQRLFELSPVGTLPTAIAIFLFLLATFEACATLAHYSLHNQLSFGSREGAWPATILSLLIALVLGLQRYVHTKDIEEEPQLARILPCDLTESRTASPAARAKLRWAGAAGAAIGLTITFVATASGVRAAHFLVFLWFACIDMLVGILFVRGTVWSQYATRTFANRVDHHLKVDLLRVDELSIMGRGSARAALIWLSVAAVICLFFVSGQTPALVISIVVVSAGIALWIFFHSLSHVHRIIHNTKLAELDRVRHAIASCQLQAEHDHAAAVRLHGLIAYEKRIAEAREWPFDHLTLLRVGVYALIPAIPSLGQLLMTHFMGHTGQ